MEIKKADTDMFDFVKEITHSTIKKVYPLYYPSGAVEFFINFHNDDRILNDIKSGYTYLMLEGATPIATVTIKENHITRMFVLPKYQHKGYGRSLLNFAENVISQNYTKSVLDASLCAKSIYLKRGYVDKEYYSILTDNGDYLCYDVMEKKLDQ